MRPLSMAKLYFRHGTVGSAKTLNLLAVAHNYQAQGKRVVLIKPKLDSRFGEAVIRSRAGLEKPADIVVDDDDRLEDGRFDGVACVLVDEVQFLRPAVIDELRRISRDRDVPVICYGLRTDFRTQLFDGARRLLEIADSIEELKTTCYFCDRKAIFNLKLLNGAPTLAGPSVELGGEEKYLPACAACYSERTAGL